MNDLLFSASTGPKVFIGISAAVVVVLLYYSVDVQYVVLTASMNYVTAIPPIFTYDVTARDRHTTTANRTTAKRTTAKRTTAKRTTAKHTTTARPETLKRGKQDILLLTEYRSGSSFVGRILNEHPDIAYLFEPLQLIARKSTKGKDTNASRIDGFMRKLFNCSFTDASQYFIRDSRRTRLSPVACSMFMRYGPGGAGGCTADDVKRLETTCIELPQAVAIKTIRIYEIHLKLVLEFLREHLQVIHLVRDPRGTISSRLTISASHEKQTREIYIKKNFEKLVEQTSSHCRRIRDAVDRIASWKADDPSFNDFYHLVRYEDFAYHPETAARRLYADIGMSIHERVLTWLRKATGNSQSKSLYSTVRNSTQTAEAWRYKLPFRLVSAMQNSPDCQYVMRTLGYRVAKSESMLLDRSLSLVKGHKIS